MNILNGNQVMLNIRFIIACSPYDQNGHMSRRKKSRLYSCGTESLFQLSKVSVIPLFLLTHFIHHYLLFTNTSFCLSTTGNCLSTTSILYTTVCKGCRVCPLGWYRAFSDRIVHFRTILTIFHILKKYVSSRKTD